MAQFHIGQRARINDARINTHGMECTITSNLIYDYLVVNAATPIRKVWLHTVDIDGLTRADCGGGTFAFMPSQLVPLDDIDWKSTDWGKKLTTPLEDMEHAS